MSDEEARPEEEEPKVALLPVRVRRKAKAEPDQVPEAAPAQEAPPAPAGRKPRVSDLGNGTTATFY